jgi:hypothetical protein
MGPLGPKVLKFDSGQRPLRVVVSPLRGDKFYNFALRNGKSNSLAPQARFVCFPFALKAVVWFYQNWRPIIF